MICLIWWSSCQFKSVIYQPQDKKAMNPRLCPSILNGFIKPRIFREMLGCVVSMAERRKLKSGLYCLYNCIYKTKVLFQKTEVMLGTNIVWLPWAGDLLFNLKPVIYQPKDEKQMNPRLCSLVCNGFIKRAIIQQLIEYFVSMVKRWKFKSG